ncbi:unnamed protein product, partial [Choristocarpus tenellus]
GARRGFHLVSHRPGLPFHCRQQPSWTPGPSRSVLHALCSVCRLHGYHHPLDSSGCVHVVQLMVMKARIPWK